MIIDITILRLKKEIHTENSALYKSVESDFDIDCRVSRARRNVK